MHPFSQKLISFKLVCALVFCLFGGCNQVRLPRIDPTGNRLFVPGNASYANPYQAIPAYQAPRNPLPCPTPQAIPSPGNQTPPPSVPPINLGAQSGPIGSGVRNTNIPGGGLQLPPPPQARILPPAPEVTIPRKSGRIILTPDEIVAPVGSEVIVMAGLCGNDGHFVIRQPIEWMLSQESVGNFVTVANGPNQLISGVFGKGARKISTGFAMGTTSASTKRLTKGTPSPGDDQWVLKGQTWVSLTSPSEGTSFVTTVAPKAEGWDRRRSTAKIHWLDARWQMPQSVTLRNGQTHELPIKLSRGNGEPISDWKVSYEIVSGSNVGFLPSGSQKAEINTNSLGETTVGIRQMQNGPANAQVRIQVIRPGNPFGSQRRLVVADQVVTVRWTAPALSIDVAGPDNVGRDAEYTYRVTVRNPGDAVARDTVLKLTGIDPNIEILSTTPKARQIGQQLEWNLGNVSPTQVPLSIDVKLKSRRAGKRKVCFSVTSIEDGIGPIDACLESTVAVPCIGLKINGPTAAEIGEVLNYRLRIENQCEQPISGINLVANFDSGLEYPGETSPIQQRLTRQIKYGEYTELEIPFTAAKAGRQCFTIDVEASDGSKARIQQCVQVTESARPAASISINGPAIAEVSDAGNGNKTETYKIDVKNTGNTALTNVEVAVIFDTAFEPNRAQDGYRQRGNDQLYWLIERVEPGEILQFAVEQYLIKENNNALHIASVKSREGILVKDQVRTAIRPGRQPINPAPALNNRGNVRTNQLQMDAAAVTNPVNPNDNARVNVTLLNDRAPQDFENNVLLEIEAPSDLQLSQVLPQGYPVKAAPQAQSTIYSIGPIRSLRGSMPLVLNFDFKPTKANQKYRIRFTTRSDRSQPIQEDVEITVTQ